MPSITAHRFPTGQSAAIYNREPDVCPFCHHSITAVVRSGYLKSGELQIVYQCPNSSCYNIFLAYYLHNGNSNYSFQRTSIGTIRAREFSADVTLLSPLFVEIYNQAVAAEGNGLQHISGIGYRKSIEFLIKDYLISKHPEKKEAIERKFLGNCIKEDVSNQNIKDMASRAVWLGNDETHYTKKWTDKDVEDLKRLIDVTLHWIDMELLTEKYKSEMI